MKTNIVKTYIQRGGMGPIKTFKHGQCTGPYIVIPAKGLRVQAIKRLVEIAGMDEGDLIQLIETALHNGNGRIGSDIAKALGLGSQSRKGRLK